MSLSLSLLLSRSHSVSVSVSLSLSVCLSIYLSLSVSLMLKFSDSFTISQNFTFVNDSSPNLEIRFVFLGGFKHFEKGRGIPTRKRVSRRVFRGFFFTLLRNYL